MNAIRNPTNGRFRKGHPALNVKPGHVGGHPKTPAREVRDALKIAEDAMPEIILAMIARTLDPNVPVAVQQAASEYLCDRIYGKPNQPLSNKDGSHLPTFAFMIPAGVVLPPGGLFSGNSDTGKTDQRN